MAWWNKKEPNIEELAVKLANKLKQNETTHNSGHMNEGVRGRIANLISGGYDYSDTLHNIYLDFGYPLTIQFSQFWNMYRRFGIAKNIVELPTDAGWSSSPMIEGNDSFNKDMKRLEDEFNFFVRLKGLDTRQRVGRYAGLLMRVKDNKKLDQPIEGTLSGLGSLVEMMPLYESQLKVVESNQDPTSEDFGQPVMYQYSGSVEGGRNPDAVQNINIHSSRVVVAAEDADNGWIYGISSLEAPYNSLMDLRKIIGAGGEGFYKNAAQSIVFDLKDAASASNNKELLDAFNEKYDEFSQNRSRRSIWTPGMEAKTLDSSLTNPKEFFMNALNDVAAASKIPATILIGQQTGRLASSEDSRNFLAMVNSRRENFMTEMITNVVDWMIQFGLLPASEYIVEWDDLLARSDDEKLGNAKSMSEINERQFKSGGDIPFNGEEIREAAGFEPEEEVEPGSEKIIEEEE